MTTAEGEKLNSLLGITSISSDFTFENGVLGLSKQREEQIEQVTVTVSELNTKVNALEESYTWEDL